MKHTIKIQNTTIDELFIVLSKVLLNGVKTKVDKTIRDNFEDGIKRTATHSHTLQPGRRDGNKLSWREFYYFTFEPGRKDITGGEVDTRRITDDALSFTGLQIRADVLLEVEYLDTWQELLDWALAELQLLYGGLPVTAAVQVDTVEPEKPKQKGRYRLTPEAIKARKKIVKEAEKRKRTDPRKTIKEIAYELDIPERTLREWRRANYQ